MVAQLKQYKGRALSDDERELVERYKGYFNSPIFKINAGAAGEGCLRVKKERRGPSKPKVK